MVSKLLDCSSLITVETKQLGSQYCHDFPFLAEMKGRGNYRCALQTELACDEGLCTLADFECVDKWTTCPYYRAKGKAIGSRSVATNISYFLHESNYSSGELCSGRDFLTIDEGHLLENALMNFVAIPLSSRSLEAIGIDLPDFRSSVDARDWARKIHPLVSEKANALEPHAGENVEKIRLVLRHRRMAGRLKSLATIHPAKWFLASDLTGYTLRPFFIDEFVTSLVLKHADKVLMMSATFLSPKVMARILGLNVRDIGWHQMDSNFPPERRPFNYVPLVRINRKAGPESYDKLAAGVDEVLLRHAGQKGVVHTSSFKVAGEILSRTHYGSRFITHRRASQRRGGGLSRDDAIQKFLHARQPLVLISPSAGLGLDLHDDLARFQVIAKINWANLGDPLIRLRQKRDPEWYAFTAVAATVQAYGRSTRHVQDYSTTYLLDSSFNNLLNRYPHLFPGWWKEAYHRTSSIASARIAKSA